MNIKVYFNAIALSLGATSMVLLWHLLMPSMLNGFRIAGDGLEQIVALHNTFPAFARRPLTTQTVYLLMSVLNCSVQMSFTIVSFVFLFLNGVLLSFLSFFKNNTQKQVYFNILFFYGSFSIFFSFFAPIYTYDEPIQYFCLLCAMLLLERKYILLSFPFLLLGLVARETSILLFPALYFFSLDKNAQTEFSFLNLKTYFKTVNIRHIVVFLLAFAAYLAFNNWFFGGLPVDANRDKEWHGNVVSAKHIIESICSCLLVLLLPMTILYKTAWRKQNKANQNIFIIICITLIINTLITFGFSFARESRIFALPLLLFFPIAGQLFEPFEAAFFNIENLKAFFNAKNIFTTIATTLLPIALMIHFYHSTDSAGMTDYYHVYLSFVLFFVGYLHFLTKKII
jgi:hypothetical protein